MRCVILCVGRLKAGPEREIEARYLERARALGRGLGLAPIEVVELAESPARRAEDRMAEEAERLLAALPADAALIGLDERGKSWPSGDFAGYIAKERDSGRGSLVFVLGGPDGLGEVVRKRADRLLAFGAATWPHQLVRLMLAEQIYRAATILAGHPYHRA